MFVCILIRSRSHHIVNPCLKLTRVLDPWLSDLIKSGCGRWKLSQISKLVFCQGFKIKVCWRFWFWSVININFMGLIGIFIPFIKPRWIILKKTRHNLPSYWMGHRQFVWEQIEMNQLSYQANYNQLWNYPPHRAYFAFDFRWRSILF